MTKFQVLGWLLQWLSCNTDDHISYTNDITLITKHLNTFWYRIYRQKPIKSTMLRIPPDMKAKYLRFTNLRTDWVTPMTLSYPSDIRCTSIISGRYVLPLFFKHWKSKRIYIDFRKHTIICLTYFSYNFTFPAHFLQLYNNIIQL
jgi:hypothetical protein